MNHPADASSQSGAGWDESQCTAALAQLEQLQSQIDELRLAVPRIIEPFHQPFTPSTFKSYAQGAFSSQNGIKALSDQWKSSETQNVFEHVKKSYAANQDLSGSMSIPSHGWRGRERNKIVPKMSGNGDGVEILETDISDEDISRTLDDFRKRHPNIKVEIQDNNSNILVRFVSGSVTLVFNIGIERHAKGGHKLSAECVGSTQLSQAITRCLALQSKGKDLEYILYMIVAYKSMTPASCAKCAKIFDRTMLPPAARRRKQNATTDGPLDSTWEAVHEGCIE